MGGWKLCVEWGSTNTSWHTGVHYVKISTHTWSAKLKHDGIWRWGIYDSNGWGIYSFNGWGSYDKLSYLWKICLKKHWSSGAYAFQSLQVLSIYYIPRGQVRKWHFYCRKGCSQYQAISLRPGYEVIIHVAIINSVYTIQYTQQLCHQYIQQHHITPEIIWYYVKFPECQEIKHMGKQ